MTVLEDEKPRFLVLTDISRGGRYVWNGEFFSDTLDSVEGIDGKIHVTNQATIWRWRRAYQHDLAARADWSVAERADANHNPVVIVNTQAGKQPVQIVVEAGGSVDLDASGTSDPDGDELTVRWWIYHEAGTYRGAEASISDPGAWQTTMPVTRRASGRSIHVICEVWDNGTPALSAFRRVIVRAVDGERCVPSR